MVETDLVKTSELEFVLHVIPPPMRIDWSSPRSLFISTLLNHARKDKAPIGHLYVEFPLLPNAASGFTSKVAGAIEGGRRVITGMSRKKMSLLESLKLVQGKWLGLGSFFYDFNGKLDSTQEAYEEISWAKKQKRHATIRVSISKEKAQLMAEFLKEWIERGSFRHYSGGLRVDIGEGAGCAEFGMHFLGMALGLHAVNPEWMRRVRIPHHLIGGGFAGHAERVGVWNIFKDGNRWAYGNEPHHVYSIPDPDLIFDWIRNNNSQLIPGEIKWNSGEFIRRAFEVSYPLESVGSIQEQWIRVVEK